ncbi:MAG: hypothetical protein JJ896_04705 [Rhodothermales bacterium]|nr:hypothetical protein [Rhodothermales bacterium]MBO6778933.1 hypothetical protein [Rhodothermales bacterium]
MFEKFTRAILITAVATAGAAWVLSVLQDRKQGPRGLLGPGAAEVDADALPDEQRRAMLDELEAQL